MLSNYFLGDDTLEGGPGDDLIEGGNGADTFVFSPGDGNDTIAKFSVDLNNITESKVSGRDFEPGKDKLDLVSFDYKDFNQVERMLNIAMLPGQEGRILEWRGRKCQHRG